MIRLLFILLVGLSASAQTWNQADSLTNLLTKPPVIGGWYSVKGHRMAGDYGVDRTARHVPGSLATTNAGNIFAFGNGRLIFSDATNAIQRLAWWGGGPLASDNTPALTNAAAWVSGLGGGYVEAGHGTHPFLSGGILIPSGVRLRGAGVNATIFNFTAATPAYDYEPTIRWEGEIAASVRLHSAPTAGTRSLVLATNVGWSNLDLIQIANTNQYSFGSRWYYHDGEFNFVDSVSGGTNVTVIEPIESAYPTAYTVLNKVTPTVGSAEGIHFALHATGGAITLDYADRRSYFRNVSASGTEENHFAVRRSYGVRIENPDVRWDSDPAAALNGGLVVGDSEYVVVDGGFYQTSRHGFTAGGSTIPTRYLRVINATIGSTRQGIAGADFHGDVVDSEFDGCVMLSGVNLGGGRNALRNSRLRNGSGIPAISTGEARYFAWVIENNEIECSPESVSGMRLYLQAGNQTGYPASTNYWPGTFGATGNQGIRIEGNTFRWSGVRTNANYVFAIDEATTLAANSGFTPSTFGPLVMRNNWFFPSPDQAFTELTTPIGYIETRSKVLFSDVIIEGNHFVGGAPSINLNSGNLAVRNNTFRDVTSKEGLYVLPLTGFYTSPTDILIEGNLFDRCYGSAFFVANTGGRVVARGNRIFNHGFSADSSYKYAMRVSETGSGTVSSGEFSDNYVTSSNSPTYDLYFYSAAAPLRESGTWSGGSVTAGTRNAGGGWVNSPRLAGAAGSTNAVSLVGQYPTASLPTGTPPGFAFDATVNRLAGWDGSAWSYIRSHTDTNYPNLRVTNTIAAKDIAAETLSIGRDWPGQIDTIRGRLNAFLYANTNAFAEAQIYNASTGSGAAAMWNTFTDGAIGRFGSQGTNNASANAKARVGVYAVTGSGLQFDLAYPGSMDVVWTHGGGTEFARLSTNTLNTPQLTTLAPTNVPTHVLSTSSDPSGTRRAVGSFAVTSAGLALLNASNAAAQRTSLGLGTLAELNDAPSDGNQYVRSNATWAVASGGGGGISGIRVTDGTTDADGITNLYLLPAVGSGLYVQVSDLGTQASVDIDNTAPGFGINGSFPSYATARWNINDTTPAAPTDTTLARPQTSGTNVSLVVDVAPTIAPITSQSWSNSTAYVLVASGVLNSTNLPYDGAILQGFVAGRWLNNSGSSPYLDPVFMVNGVTNYWAGVASPTASSSASPRVWKINFEFVRESATSIGGGFDYVFSAAASANVGFGTLQSAPTGTLRPAGFASTTCSLTTNVTWGLYLSTSIANNTNIVTVTHGGLK